MAKNKAGDNNDAFDEAADEIFDEYEDVESRQISHKGSSDARRRHEQLKEERELERLLGNDFHDWDYGRDYVDWD